MPSRSFQILTLGTATLFLLALFVAISSTRSPSNKLYSPPHAAPSSTSTELNTLLSLRGGGVNRGKAKARTPGKAKRSSNPRESLANGPGTKRKYSDGQKLPDGLPKELLDVDTDEMQMIEQEMEGKGFEWGKNGTKDESDALAKLKELSTDTSWMFKSRNTSAKELEEEISSMRALDNNPERGKTFGDNIDLEALLGIPETNITKFIKREEGEIPDSLIAEDADNALVCMMEGIANRTVMKQERKEELEERIKAKLETNPIHTESEFGPTTDPDRASSTASESIQVGDFFNMEEFIGHIKTPLVQLGLMRLPFHLYKNCNFHDISYVDLEEASPMLERYTKGLQGVGTLREIKKTEEEEMKRGMRIAISRFKSGEFAKKRESLRSERISFIDGRVRELQMMETMKEVTRQQLMNVDNPDAYNNPDVSNALRPTPLNSTAARLRYSRSMLQFFKTDPELEMGSKTVSRIANHAFNRNKKQLQLRTMFNYLKKLHVHPQGLNHALIYFLSQHLSQNQNIPRIERMVLEEMKWFYERGVF